jgi:hypothetical protein
MDYCTAKSSDMYPCDLLRGEYEERGQTATFTQSDEHRWYYMEKQRTNEVTVIKIWDNGTDGGISKCEYLNGVISSPVSTWELPWINLDQFARMRRSITQMHRWMQSRGKVLRSGAWSFISRSFPATWILKHKKRKSGNG